MFKYNNIFRIFRFVESGIYEHEFKKTLKPKGYEPDYDSEVDINAYEYGAIGLDKSKGIFILYVLCKLFCIVIFIFEIILLFLKRFLAH